MFQQTILKLKKTGRVCYPFPWENHKLECPWRKGYSRVLVPLNETEARGSTKKVHCQIVKNSNLAEIKEHKPLF